MLRAVERTPPGRGQVADSGLCSLALLSATAADPAGSDTDTPKGRAPMRRLLETVCALTVGVLVALLVWGADPGAVQVAWRKGELSGLTIVLVGTCALWLVLWRKRTGRGRPAWPLSVLLWGAAIALVAASMAG